MLYISVVKKGSLEFIVKVNRDLHEKNFLEYLRSENHSA